MEEILKKLQLSALVQCRDCIQEKTPLYPYVGKIKIARPTEDEKGVLFTIRCNFPDDLNEPLTKKNFYDGLNDIINAGDLHMLVMQRR